MKNINKENDKCAVCLLKKHRPTKIDSCQHSFCYKCLKNWSKRKNSCPICREKFTKMIKLERKSRTKAHAIKSIDQIAQKSQQVAQTDLNDESLEQKIFSNFTKPQTRKNHIQFLNIYLLLDNLLQDE